MFILDVDIKENGYQMKIEILILNRTRVPSSSKN